MGVALTTEEMTEFLKKGHTLILATVRKTGEPVATPLWYVYDDDECFYVSTYVKTTKLAHIRRDPRVSALVEQGEHYRDLKAVAVNCTAEFVEDETAIDRLNTLVAEKYKGFTVDFSKAGEATQKRYKGQVWLRLRPKPGGIRSWDNRKLRLPGGA